LKQDEPGTIGSNRRLMCVQAYAAQQFVARNLAVRPARRAIRSRVPKAQIAGALTQGGDIYASD